MEEPLRVGVRCNLQKIYHKAVIYYDLAITTGRGCHRRPMERLIFTKDLCNAVIYIQKSYESSSSYLSCRCHILVSHKYYRPKMSQKTYGRSYIYKRSVKCDLQVIYLLESPTESYESSSYLSIMQESYTRQVLQAMDLAEDLQKASYLQMTCKMRHIGDLSTEVLRKLFHPQKFCTRSSIYRSSTKSLPSLIDLWQVFHLPKTYKTRIYS